MKKQIAASASGSGVRRNTNQMALRAGSAPLLRMSIHEHTTDVIGHLIGFGPLIRRQHSVELGERLSAKGGHLPRQVPDVSSELIEVRAGFAGFDGIPHSLPALPELLSQRLRRGARRLPDRPGLLLLIVRQVELGGCPFEFLPAIPLAMLRRGLGRVRRGRALREDHSGRERGHSCKTSYCAFHVGFNPS